MRSKTKIPRILKINKVEGFTVFCAFNTGELRSIDIAKLFAGHPNAKPGEIEYDLLVPENFKQVSLSDSQTLFWPNVGMEMEEEGKKTFYPYDLDPIVLYEASEPAESPGFDLGGLIKQVRKQHNLTQEELAIKSGTTKGYISRLEKNQSDVEMGTLLKIVSIGLEEPLEINIGDFQAKFPVLASFKTVEQPTPGRVKTGTKATATKSYASSPRPKADRNASSNRTAQTKIKPRKTRK